MAASAASSGHLPTPARLSEERRGEGVWSGSSGPLPPSFIHSLRAFSWGSFIPGEGPESLRAAPTLPVKTSRFFYFERSCW